MNMCKETCPIFNGICNPEECDKCKDKPLASDAVLDEVRAFLTEIKIIALAIESNTIRNRLLNAIENYENGKPLLHDVLRWR